MQKYQELEIKWAEWNELDPRGMVACSSGTAALHLAIEAMRLRYSHLIIPDFTMIACPRAVVLSGKHPAFIDCDDQLLINPELIYPMISRLSYPPGGERNPGGIIVVHIYGRKCDMETIAQYIKPPLIIIEDLAEAHGVRVHDSTDAACWSFYKNKIVAGEEGGAVWFKNIQHAELAKKLRSLGFTDNHDFYHIPRGHNYRLSNCHAELVLKSLEQVDINIDQRQTMINCYNDYIDTTFQMPDTRVSPWCYDIKIPSCKNLDSVVNRLRQEGIEARHSFKPMSIQEEFILSPVISQNIALRASKEVLYLPIFPVINISQMRRIAEIINNNVL
jgi:perosamine synthetase